MSARLASHFRKLLNLQNVIVLKGSTQPDGQLVIIRAE